MVKGLGVKAWVVLVLLVFAMPVRAHIGSPDTFVQAAVGPYAVLVGVHPPGTAPGAMEVDLRFHTDDGLTGATVALDDGPPNAVRLVPDGTAAVSLWCFTPAAHTLHLAIVGSRGTGTYEVVLPAMTAKKADAAGPVLLGVALGFAMLAVLYWRWRPGSFRAGLAVAAVLAVCVMAVLLVRSGKAGGATVTAELTPDAHLNLDFANPRESFSDLVADHGRLLHLFLVREPRKDVLLHLHPVLVQTLEHGARFNVALPAMPPGTYALFADLYHREGGSDVAGRGETVSATLTLPAQVHSASADPDDTSAVLPPMGAAGSSAGFGTARLADGYSMVLRTPAELRPLRAVVMEATLFDPAGHAPADMALYLGMNAHAVALRDDDGVFAHIHPGGTLPMLAGGPMLMVDGPVSNVAAIPYGFPAAGRYRVFVQMKHGGRVETAAFDLVVR